MKENAFYEVTFDIPPELFAEFSAILPELGCIALCETKLNGKKCLIGYMKNIKILEETFSADLFTAKKINTESYLNKWYEEYAGREINEDLFVVIDGHALPDKKYRYIIKLLPLQAFGDAHHATTAYCLGKLYNVLNNLNDVKDISLLDIGTGSGIVAILAARLGVKNIKGFDNDKSSVAYAIKNQKLNALDTCNFFQADIYSYKDNNKYEIVVANLLSTLIADNLSKIKGLLKESGYLIISGIGAEHCEEIEQRFLDEKLKIEDKTLIDNWAGYLLRHA